MFAIDDVTFSTSGIVIITGLLGAIAAALTAVSKLLLAAKDEQIKELREQRDSFKKVADRAVSALESEAERRQIARGESPIPMIAPVVREHNSPPTERQRIAADFETLNARQVAAKLAIEGVIKKESVTLPVEPPKQCGYTYLSGKRCQKLMNHSGEHWWDN